MHRIRRFRALEAKYSRDSKRHVTKSASAWNKLAIKETTEASRTAWSVAAAKKQSLKLYAQHTTELQQRPFYCGDRESSFFQARTGSLLTQQRRHKLFGFDPECQLCWTPSETIDHTLYDCPKMPIDDSATTVLAKRLALCGNSTQDRAGEAVVTKQCLRLWEQQCRHAVADKLRHSWQPATCRHKPQRLVPTRQAKIHATQCHSLCQMSEVVTALLQKQATSHRGQLTHLTAADRTWLRTNWEARPQPGQKKKKNSSAASKLNQYFSFLWHLTAPAPHQGRLGTLTLLYLDPPLYCPPMPGNCTCLRARPWKPLWGLNGWRCWRCEQHETPPGLVATCGVVVERLLEEGWQHRAVWSGLPRWGLSSVCSFIHWC